MNKYPAWLNTLVLLVLLTGLLLALPNIYGTVPAVQVADADGASYTEERLESFLRTIENSDISPEAAYLKDGRAVFRFESIEEQRQAESRLRERYGREASIAITQAPKLPDWVRNLGLDPMSLGLDLRGGVYVLLEVDMDTAIDSRMTSYQQGFDERLRDARIRHRVDLNELTITVRLTSADDLEAARAIIRDADADVLIADGTDGKSLQVRMTEAQIKARQDFAIEQNITTLRNRVNELGVAEPLVQRQGTDRIVVQLPGVQDPTRLNEIITATATIEFRLVDLTGDQPGTREYRGRPGIQSQKLRRDVIASGDQIVNAEAGFSEGQPAVFINLDSAGGERMLATTRDNVGKPMSTVFIETKREAVTRNGVTEYRRIKTEEIINTATIRGVFKDRFQTTGLNPTEARDLALLLRAGALAAPVYKVDERTIGPNLGQDNIDRGFRAVQIGFLAVIVF
ncbi:MAG: protein translocase subunit SecD, partial [Gammaproteobacteria bacterium]|nr:protein translocase subunit SecD [Gammaproteobacteria bacterium]